MMEGLLVVLAIMLALLPEITFMVGFYLGRRSRYEDANKLEPTPIITAPVVKVQQEDEAPSRATLQSLLVD